MKKVKTGSHVDLTMRRKIQFICISLVVFAVIAICSAIFVNNTVADANEHNAESAYDASVKQPEPIPSDSTKPVVKPEKAKEDKKLDASVCSGNVYPGTGSHGFNGKNPYVWPVGFIGENPWVGSISPINNGKYSFTLPENFTLGFLIIGATDHQTVVRAIDWPMENVFLAAGRTTTLADASGLNNVLLKAGSKFTIAGIDVPLHNDINLGKSIPAIGFGADQGTSSTFEFKDNAKFTYKYSIQDPEAAASIQMDMQAIAKQDYHFYDWDNEMYQTNDAVPASSVKVINPIFVKKNYDIYGTVRAVSGSEPLVNHNPYVWAFGICFETGKVFVSDLMYINDKTGEYRVTVPGDFLGGIMYGADMHQTVFSGIIEEPAGPINKNLGKGNTTTVNTNAEGFKNVLVKAGSKMTLDFMPEEWRTITLEEDIDLGNKFPALGFGSNPEETSTLDFAKDKAHVDYLYRGYGHDFALKIDIDSLPGYVFDHWDNEYYKEENKAVPASSVKVINPVFVNNTPKPFPDSDLAQTGDSIPMNFIYILGALIVISTGLFIVSRRKSNF